MPQRHTVVVDDDDDNDHTRDHRQRRRQRHTTLTKSSAAATTRHRSAGTLYPGYDRVQQFLNARARTATKEKLQSLAFTPMNSNQLSYTTGTYMAERGITRFHLGTPKGSCPPRSTWQSGLVRNRCACPNGFWSKHYFLNRPTQCNDVGGRWDYSQFSRNTCYVCPSQ